MSGASSLIRHPRLPIWVAAAIGLILILNLGWKLAAPLEELPTDAGTAGALVDHSNPLPKTTVFTVYVSGAVASPGLVEVPEGSRVADALAAGGGVLSAADLGLLNLATFVRDGDHIIVPEVGAPSPVLGRVADQGVRINTATVIELESLAGVGPTTAEKIVAYRQENGPFQRVEDLLDVPGIGEGKLAGFRGQVIVP